MTGRTGTALAAAALAVFAGAQVAQAAELKVAFFPGPKHPVNARMLTPWADGVNARNAGLQVKVFVAGKLGKGPAKQWKRALDRVADVSFGLQGYTSKQFRATTLVELANTLTGARDGTRRLNEAFRVSEAIRKEYDKVKVLALWTIDPAILMFKNRAVKTVADLEGMKIRTPSQLQSRAVEALGGVPVAMPVTKIYNALARGTVDGVLIPPAALHSFKLKEVTRFYTDGIAFGASAMFLVMNRDSWNRLSPAHKDIVEKSTGSDMAATGGRIYDEDRVRGLDFIAGSKAHSLFTLPAAEVRKANALLDRLEKAVVAERQAEGIPADEILKVLRAAGT